MNSIKLKIAYDGTCYCGWQKNPGVKSIAEEVEKALFTILKNKVTLEAASRTDKGVHAEGQIACFQYDGLLPDSLSLQKSLNGLLPFDIRILSIEMVDHLFHPTICAKSKTYRYDIFNAGSQLPFFKDYSWHLPHKLNLENMKKAKERLLGEHDFTAFTNEPQENNCREIFELDFDFPSYGLLRLTITADRFLYKMVRIIVGTLAYIGLNKLDCGIIDYLLKHKDRKKAGITAPAKGLFLKKVIY